MLQRTDYLIDLIIISVLLITYFYRKRKKLLIYSWQKTLNLKQHEQTFQNLYQHINGFLLSKQARHKKDALDYIYGEIQFLPFIALLSLAKPDTKTVFYDLGSGTGKAVLACAMVFPVQRSVGIELLPELHQTACSQHAQLNKIPAYQKQTQKIHFILGDFLTTELDNATLIFINATAIFNPTWEKLCARLEQLPRLHTVITTSKALPDKVFEVIHHTEIQMSWGIVSAYIHRRINHNN